MLSYFFKEGVKLVTVADMGEGGSKIAKKVLTYFIDSPKVHISTLFKFAWVKAAH